MAAPSEPTATSVFEIQITTTTYTNFGALTTTFTPAPSCSHVLNQVYPQNGTAMSIYFRQGGHSDCYPGSIQYGYHYSIGEYAVLNTYFSPGIYCPAGWETVATLEASVADEQAYVCCPTGWKWTYTECLSEVPFTVIAQDETLVSDTVWRSGATETKTYSPNDINNWPVEIHYRPLDLPGYHSTTSSGNSAQTRTPTNSTPQKSGLSTGAKIGIGVSIPVVVIIILLGICLFFRRRAKRPITTSDQPGELAGNAVHEKDSNSVTDARYESPTGGHPWDTTQYPPSELPSSEAYIQHDWAYSGGHHHELDGQIYQEVPSQTHYSSWPSNHPGPTQEGNLS